MFRYVDRLLLFACFVLVCSSMKRSVYWCLALWKECVLLVYICVFNLSIRHEKHHQQQRKVTIVTNRNDKIKRYTK